MIAIFAAQARIEQQEQAVIGDLHRPENRVLHDQINIETVKGIGPVLADVIKQGCDEGVFCVPDPLSTVQFLLAGSQTIFGRDAFDWTPEELKARHEAMMVLIERGLGAAPGSIANNRAGIKSRNPKEQVMSTSDQPNYGEAGESPSACHRGIRELSRPTGISAFFIWVPRRFPGPYGYWQAGTAIAHPSKPGPLGFWRSLACLGSLHRCYWQAY